MVSALGGVASRDVASMVVVTFKVRVIVIIGGTTTCEVGCGDTSVPATFGVGSCDD
jgi:hypothetical protein